MRNSSRGSIKTFLITVLVFVLIFVFVFVFTFTFVFVILFSMYFGWPGHVFSHPSDKSLHPGLLWGELQRQNKWL